MRDERAVPQWAKTAIIVLEVVGAICFAVVTIFIDDALSIALGQQRSSSEAW